MTDELVETVERKLARYETVIGLQMEEIDRLRAENERLRSEGGAHAALKDVYLNPDAPQGNRIKAATAALPHETPRLTPQPPVLDLTAEPCEPLADVIARQRARCNALQPPYQLGPEGHTVLLIKGNGDSSSD